MSKYSFSLTDLVALVKSLFAHLIEDSSHERVTTVIAKSPRDVCFEPVPTADGLPQLPTT